MDLAHENVIDVVQPHIILPSIILLGRVLQNDDWQNDVRIRWPQYSDFECLTQTLSLLSASDLFRRQQSCGGVDQFEELGAVALLVGSAR